jgi:ectoine hydroxylase-related dioxygenase (phytanoyl-CoA dioxygenase family)
MAGLRARLGEHRQAFILAGFEPVLLAVGARDSFDWRLSMAALKEFDISAPSADILRAIDEDGGIIVRNFISPELLEQLASDLQSHADGMDPGIPGDSLKSLVAGKNTKRFTGLAAKSPAFAKVIDHDLLHEWASSAIGADYWMNTGQAMIVGPGSVNQPLHRDFGNWSLAEALGSGGAEVQVSIVLAISDFTPEVGATRVVPGSHKWADYAREAKEDEITQAVMKPGSALLYTGRLIHGAGANVTEDRWRFGIHLSFCLSELVPEEANCLTVPWEIAKNYSERVKHMLGFYSLRPHDPETPTIWLSDYREVRDQFLPEPSSEYVRHVNLRDRPQGNAIDFIKKQVQ